MKNESGRTSFYGAAPRESGLEIGSPVLNSIIEMNLRTNNPMLIVGNAGIGKTDIVVQALAGAGYGNAEIHMLHPAGMERVDAVGHPRIVQNGDVRALRYDVEALYGPLTRRDGTKIRVLWVAQLEAAPKAVQIALMELWDGRHGNRSGRVADDVRIVAEVTGLGASPSSSVAELLPTPVRSRFSAVLEVRPAWSRWALHEIHRGKKVKYVAAAMRGIIAREMNAGKVAADANAPVRQVAPRDLSRAIDVLEAMDAEGLGPELVSEETRRAIIGGIIQDATVTNTLLNVIPDDDRSTKIIRIVEKISAAFDAYWNNDLRTANRMYDRDLQWLDDRKSQSRSARRGVTYR